MKKLVHESNTTMEIRSKRVMSQCREKTFGINSRPQVSDKLTQLLNRPIPKTTYTGWEKDRTAPLDVKIALASLYGIPLWKILGLECNPDNLLKKNNPP
jgi:hypothetical protein